VEDESSQSPKWNSEPNCPTSQPIRKISRVCSNPISEPSVVDLAELMESSELAELSNQVHENSSYSTRKVSVASQVVKDTSYDEDSWDKLYNDTGDLLRPDALEEVKHFSLFFVAFSLKRTFFFYESQLVTIISRIS